MSAFWGLGLLYGMLDMFRPAFANPYKIQEGIVISKSDFAKAMGMALINQLILLTTIFGVWKLFPYFCPDGFSREVPSLLTAVVHMLSSLIFSELVRPPFSISIMPYLTTLCSQ